MNRRATTCALILGLSLISGCAQDWVAPWNIHNCAPPGCDLCDDPPCATSSCSPCARVCPCAAESQPAPETRASEDIVAALRSGDRATRERAVDSLAQRGTVILPQIETLLSDPDASVRFSALQVLVRMRHDAFPAIYHVKYRLQDPDPAIRAEAATVVGLAGSGGAEAIPELTWALSDSSTVVRYRAAVAFQNMDNVSEPAREALERHSRCDRDPRVREACKCALYKLCRALGRRPTVTVYHD